MKVPNVMTVILTLLQRFGALGAVTLLLIAAGLAAGCGGGGAMASPEVESDPEVLARALVEASYEREYEFLWEHASVQLKQYYGMDDGNFLLSTTKTMDEIVTEGSTDVSKAQVDYTELAGVRGYDIAVEAPDGTLQAFRAFLVQENEETWAYCELQGSTQEDGYQDLVGDNDDSACF